MNGCIGADPGYQLHAGPPIANAIADALAPFGVEIFELPMTPERLFRLVKQARAPA